MPPPSPAPKMHPDELDIDAALVERLVAGQFPAWAGLPVKRVVSAGTDNAMYRLGDDMVVRLPRLPGGAGQVAKEQRWLPRLAPHLPLAVPEPLAEGAPGEGYPLPWGVFRWLDGDNVHDAPFTDGTRLADAAVSLGRFVAALRAVDAVGGPPSWRGGPLTDDDRVRAAIRDLGADGRADAAGATAAWEDALRVPRWDGAPVWLHGDLLPGNLLARQGRLSAVIDFGGLGTGDPAADVLAAWAVLTPGTRRLFRDAAGADDATWARGRGWALYFGLTAEHHYRVTNPVLAAVGHRAVAEALADTE
ncbi:aminoglycoside phosphotransferase (APT) family kinase protein [Streptomyces sp. V3I8]|uniref:aminoglycoside phosphotransferase family protein n=1 Tax=Streptomyces sp. V3I8 TaxID=3042279 RepID=UPI00277E6126|nr:aminoglycoside phosphotransferase family protein [Streptomyces sp. V3I8]MDQ1038795.1 aminoglycoside phosphotransferase (APT) family kinase protein [Streptomyces sp. V3I8]